MKALSPQLLSLLLVAATFHLLPPSSAAAITSKAPASAPGPISASADFIQSVCNITGDGSGVCYSCICYSFISPYANVINQNPNTLCCVGLTLAQSVARRVATYISGLKGRFSSDCNFCLGVATDQISDSLGTIQQIAAGKGGDFNFTMFKVLTEMSAAMTNQDTCMDEFLEEPHGPVKKRALDLLAEAKTFTGIAMAFVDCYSDKGSP
ncbi:hypothetical protein K1719_026097 [Acacia pycnantha]|nr:hypothetical protein K1719_026097 [Acacia pycnantha]